ncbi:hypothetical protein [Kibdelosporangium aridum]|uniref:hypothetical protein n=1 Tax=Kibdelosporangium aridum TaxID=2030 RepID=UPI0035E8B5DF
MIRRPVLIGAAALLLAGCSSTPEPAPASTPPAPAAEPAAEQVKAEPLTPQRLQTVWWSWASSAEPGQNPVEDPTGQYCGDSQPFGVWLIAGTPGGTADRHCQVPATLPLAGPAATQVTQDAASCTRFLATAKGEALLDGKPVQLEKIEPTKITYDTEQGVKEGYSCGLWVRIDPLSPGQHTLTLRGSSGTFNNEANYDLTVVRLP